MPRPDLPYWRQASEPFDKNAAEYDRWFSGSSVFASELAALRAVRTPLGSPALELGIGPGHFAAALGLPFGIDPAGSALLRARDRGVMACRAIGEELPFGDKVFGAVHLLFTDCFLEEPKKVFRECCRVLKPGGHLVVGMIPADSAWGKSLAAKGAAGHPMYARARFRTADRIMAMLAECGLEPVETVSSLFLPPDVAEDAVEEPVAGPVAGAGFLVIVAARS